LQPRKLCFYYSSTAHEYFVINVYIYLTHSMQQSFSLEASSSSVAPPPPNSAFYRTRRLMCFQRARHWPISSTRCILSTFSSGLFEIHFNIILPFALWSPKWFHLFRFSEKGRAPRRNSYFEIVKVNFGI
jgi:hypothetical protein